MAYDGSLSVCDNIPDESWGKNYKYPSKIFWILFFPKNIYDFKIKVPCFINNPLFWIVQNLYFLNKGQNTNDGS